jgi:hypothetical protein
MKILKKRHASQNEGVVEFIKENYNLALSFFIPGLAAGSGIALHVLRKEYAWTGVLSTLILIIYVFIGYLQNHNRYLIPSIAPTKNKAKVSISEKGLGNKAIPRNKSNASKSYNFASGTSLVKIKYCYTCKIFRPHLAVHCARCDECCLNFDHHCMWLKNCICKSNYKIFVSFLVVLSLLSVLIILSSALYTRFVEDLNNVELILLSVSIFVASIQLVFVGILMGFHVFLYTKGVNTYQYIKGKFRKAKFEPDKTMDSAKDEEQPRNLQI